MAQITIDGVAYELDALSEAARTQIANVQLADNEIQRLQMLLAITQTARSAYAAGLRNELPVTDPAKAN